MIPAVPRCFASFNFFSYYFGGEARAGGGLGARHRTAALTLKSKKRRKASACRDRSHRSCPWVCSLGDGLGIRRGMEMGWGWGRRRDGDGDGERKG